MWNSIRVHMNVCGMTGLSMNSCIFYYYEDPGKFYVIHHFIAASSTEYGHMATVCVCGCASAQDALCCVPTSDADDITDSLLNYLMKRFSCSPYALCTALMHANELIFIYSCTLNGQQHHHLHTCDDVVWHCDTATLKWIPHKVWMERIDGRMVNMANGDICTPHTTHTHTRRQARMVHHHHHHHRHFYFYTFSILLSIFHRFRMKTGIADDQRYLWR